MKTNETEEIKCLKGVNNMVLSELYGYLPLGRGCKDSVVSKPCPK